MEEEEVGKMDERREGNDVRKARNNPGQYGEYRVKGVRQRAIGKGIIHTYYRPQEFLPN